MATDGTQTVLGLTRLVLLSVMARDAVLAGPGRGLGVEGYPQPDLGLVAGDVDVFDQQSQQLLPLGTVELVYHFADLPGEVGDAAPEQVFRGQARCARRRGCHVWLAGRGDVRRLRWSGVAARAGRLARPGRGRPAGVVRLWIVRAWPAVISSGTPPGPARRALRGAGRRPGSGSCQGLSLVGPLERYGKAVTPTSSLNQAVMRTKA